MNETIDMCIYYQTLLCTEILFILGAPIPPVCCIGTTVWTTDHCDRTYSISIGSYKNIELYKNDMYPWVYTIYTQVLNLLTFL